MKKHKVVIVGGGFGGVKVALELARDNNFQITLISDRNDFRYYPSLYRTATGGRRYIASVPLIEIFEGLDVNILLSTASKLERQTKAITTTNQQTVAYDTLILALGVQTNFFHIKGLETFSYGIKTVEDAERLKFHLHKQLIEKQKLDLHYVVIGGGPTGIELAGELPAYLKTIAKRHGIKRPAVHVDLIEAAARLLPRMPKDIGKAVARRLRRLGVKLYLDTTVLAETAEELKLEDRELASQTVIWTAGVTNHPFFTYNNFQVTKNGKVRVDQFLQAEPDIYVIGDNADTPYSGMAQTALNDGAYIAHNLKLGQSKKEREPYIAKRPIYIIPAGPNWAAALWGRFRVYGRLGSLLRRLADLIAYHDYEPWRLATKRWMAEDDNEENCPICSKQ